MFVKATRELMLAQSIQINAYHDRPVAMLMLATVQSTNNIGLYHK